MTPHLMDYLAPVSFIVGLVAVAALVMVRVQQALYEGEHFAQPLMPDERLRVSLALRTLEATRSELEKLKIQDMGPDTSTLYIKVCNAERTAQQLLARH